MSNPPFLVSPLTATRDDASTRLSVEVEYGRGPTRLEIDLPADARPACPGDALFTLCLLGAMHTGLPLRLGDPVSADLLGRAPRIQRMLAGWFPDLQVVEVQAETADEAAPPRGRGVGHFFSGGIDAFHSIRRHHEGIDALVYLDGGDAPQAQGDQREAAVTRLREAARELDLPLEVVRTNAARWAGQFKDAAGLFEGVTVLFSAHLLSDRFREMIMASSAGNRLRPYPTHPLIDPLWGSDRMAVRHDPPDLGRDERIRELAEWGLPLPFLRVCPRGSAYNCGRCVKCVQTRIALHLVGALDASPVWGDEAGDFDLAQAVETVVAAPRKDFEGALMREHVELAKQQGLPEVVANGLQRAADRMQGRVLWHQAVGLGETFFEEAPWKMLPVELRRKAFATLLDAHPEWLADELAGRLPEDRQAVFEALWQDDPKWLAKTVRRARWVRRLSGKGKKKTEVKEG